MSSLPYVLAVYLVYLAHAWNCVELTLTALKKKLKNHICVRKSFVLNKYVIFRCKGKINLPTCLLRLMLHKL